MKKLLQVCSLAFILSLLISANYKASAAQPNIVTNPAGATPVWVTGNSPTTASTIQYTASLATNASAVVSAAAAGSARVQYVQLSNTSGTAQTIAVYDGNTIIWEVQPAASSTFASVVNLVGTAASALSVQNVTGTGSVFVNIQGSRY